MVHVSWGRDGLRPHSLWSPRAEGTPRRQPEGQKQLRITNLILLPQRSPSHHPTQVFKIVVNLSIGELKASTSEQSFKEFIWIHIPREIQIIIVLKNKWKKSQDWDSPKLFKLPYAHPYWKWKWKWSRSVVSDSCDPMDCSLPGSPVHRIFQARALEWVVISFSRGSSQPRDRTQVSRTAGRHFTVWATREVSDY